MTILLLFHILEYIFILYLLFFTLITILSFNRVFNYLISNSLFQATKGKIERIEIYCYYYSHLFYWKFYIPLKIFFQSTPAWWVIISFFLCLLYIILYIIYYITLLLVELTKIFLILFLFWIFYLFISYITLELLGITGLILFNTLLFALPFSLRTETRKEYYNYITSHQANREYPSWLGIKPYSYGYRVYTPEGKYSQTVEYYPWQETKILGLSLSYILYSLLGFYLIGLLIILPLIILVINVYIYSLLFILPYISTINFESFDFSYYYHLNDLFMSAGTAVQVKKLILEKYKTSNGLEIPGILFQKEYSSELMNRFNDCLSPVLNAQAFNYVSDYIEAEIKESRSILNHGFIHEVDLTNPFAFPVVSNLVELLLLKDLDSKDSNKESKSKSESFTPLQRLDTAGVKVKSDLFKQAYHLLCLNYWTLNRILLNHIKEEEFVGYKESDYFVKATHLNALLTKLLPNSIKRHLHNKSICLTNNVYAGFDTEFKNIDKKFNKLLSVQVSVNGCYTLKIPTLSNQHAFGSLDVSTNKFYETKHESKLINYNLINSLIQEAIDFNINLNEGYKNYITKLVETLISKGVKYYIKDDSYHFKFPSSHILTKFIETKNSFSMNNLFNTIMELEQLDSVKSGSFASILTLLNVKPDEVLTTLLSDFEYTQLKTDTVYDSVFDSETNSEFSKVENEENEETTPKKRIRKGLKFNRFSVYTNNIIYLTAHYNAADLSMLSDFETYKPFLNVVNKSFVVINRPIPFKQVVQTEEGSINKNWNLKISDTILLSPPGFTQLKSLGSIYNLNKLELSKAEITNMDLLLISDRSKFKEYAVRDSIITLLHYNAMIDYNFGLESSTPPSTLSQISGRAVDKYWKSINYEGYQVSPMYSLADANKIYTFKGLFETTGIGDKLPLFIQTFRGGRNESFCYGMDSSGKIWYDYDLTSAYTTIMYGLSNPIYNGGSFVSEEKFFQEFKKDGTWLLKSYFAIKCSFEFPNSIHYPCLPCNYDSDNTIYPLKGEGVYTGSEIFAALNLGCSIKIKEVFRIPKGKIEIFGLIKDLHIERGKHKKGTFNNLMCKIIGNSAYGLTAQGINEIMKYGMIFQEWFF